MSAPSSTDWITAISTAATGFFAAIAAWATFSAFRRESRRILPVVELNQSGGGGDIEFGDFLTMHLKIANRLDETLEIEKIIVKKPRHSRISSGIVGQDGILHASVGATNIIFNPTIISESGSYNEIYGLTQRADRSHIEIYIVPPKDWRSGSVRIDVVVSSRAKTIWRKRIVVMSEAKLLTPQKKQATATKIPM